MYLKRGVMYLVLLLMLIVPVLAQEEPNVILTLVDATSNEPIENMFIDITLNTEKFQYYLNEDETLKLNLENGDYNFKVLVTDQKTEGYDYYGEDYLQVGSSLIKIIYLYPVGSLNGFIKDKLDNVISEAELKFECNKAIQIDYPHKADHFGSFSLDYVPIGNCKVYGSFENNIGVKEIEVKKGDNNYVKIKLDQVLVFSKKTNELPLTLLSILAVLIFILLLFKKRIAKTVKSINKNQKQQTKEVSEKKQNLGQRGKDLFQTLRVNEKKIVEFLTQHSGSTYLSKIHHKTGISKSSLFRNLESLERKNIVETAREGKIRKVKLTDWFLEK
jgi:uncharacterized membrane protein